MEGLKSSAMPPADQKYETKIMKIGITLIAVQGLNLYLVLFLINLNNAMPCFMFLLVL